MVSRLSFSLKALTKRGKSSCLSLSKKVLKSSQAAAWDGSKFLAATTKVWVKVLCIFTSSWDRLDSCSFKRMISWRSRVVTSSMTRLILSAVSTSKCRIFCACSAKPAIAVMTSGAIYWTAWLS